MIYLFNDHQGGVGFICYDSIEDYHEAIKDCAERYDIGDYDYGY